MTPDRALAALDRAQRKIESAEAEWDAALVEATQHIRSADLMAALGLKHATFWRRVAAARERDQ